MLQCLESAKVKSATHSVRVAIVAFVFLNAVGCGGAAKTEQPSSSGASSSSQPKKPTNDAVPEAGEAPDVPVAQTPKTPATPVGKPSVPGPVELPPLPPAGQVGDGNSTPTPPTAPPVPAPAPPEPKPVPKIPVTAIPAFGLKIVNSAAADSALPDLTQVILDGADAQKHVQNGGDLTFKPFISLQGPGHPVYLIWPEKVADFTISDAHFSVKRMSPERGELVEGDRQPVGFDSEKRVWFVKLDIDSLKLDPNQISNGVTWIQLDWSFVGGERQLLNIGMQFQFPEVKVLAEVIPIPRHEHPDFLTSPLQRGRVLYSVKYQNNTNSEISLWFKTDSKIEFRQNLHHYFYADISGQEPVRRGNTYTARIPMVMEVRIKREGGEFELLRGTNPRVDLAENEVVLVNWVAVLDRENAVECSLPARKMIHHEWKEGSVRREQDFPDEWTLNSSLLDFTVTRSCGASLKFAKTGQNPPQRLQSVDSSSEHKNLGSGTDAHALGDQPECNGYYRQ